MTPETLFQQAVATARAQFQPAPHVIVTPTVILASGARVAGGHAVFPRCVAEVFEQVLTITSTDTGRIVEEYPPTYWEQAVQYSALGALEACFRAGGIA